MKNKSYFDWVNYIFVALLTVAATTVWFWFLLVYPESDTVMLFNMDRSLPNIDTILTEKNDNEWQSIAAESILLDYCVMPSLYNYLQTLPPGSQSAEITSHETSKRGMSDKWDHTFFKGWKQMLLPTTDVVLSGYNLPYGTGETIAAGGNVKGNPNLPPQHFLPMCRCFNAVLGKYRTFKDSTKIDGARNAMKSCLRTRTLIPRQRPVETFVDTLASIKSMSRSGYLLMMALVLLMNLIYRRWNLSKQLEFGTFEWFYSPWLHKLLLLLTIILLFVLPAIMWATEEKYIHPKIKYSAFIVLIGLLFLTIVESTWYMQRDFYESLRRHLYMHPFTFFITLVSLYALALLENGVFIEEILYAYFWTSLGMSCLYMGVVFCENRQVWKGHGESCRTGYLLYIFLAGLVAVVKLVPFFPVTNGLNILWVLPLCFATFSFASVVFVERVMDDDKQHPLDGNIAKFTETSHYLQMGHCVLLIIVVLYFVTVLMELAMNNKILVNENSPMNKLNYEIYQTPNKNYFEF